MIESSVVPILDLLADSGSLPAALRESVRRRRPNLDHEYIGATFIGGRNYDASAITAARVDYAVLARRNMQYVEQRCDAYPDVCDFYRALREHGRLVHETPEGYESVLIYRVGAAG